MMAGVVEYVAKGLVDDPESVSVSERDEGGRVVVRLDVAEDDWGKVIGKGGRIAAILATNGEPVEYGQTLFVIQ